MTLAQHFDTYRLWRDDIGRLVGRLRNWLAEGDLLDSQTEQRLKRINDRLADDKLVVAFVAEFSRGKSELINALFFADHGGRVLPSSAGRTTMCPTEISWNDQIAPQIALLPIETRAEGTSVADLRHVPEAWQTFPFPDNSTEAITESLRRVGEVKRVSAEVAQNLGFALEDDAAGRLEVDTDGLVEIPRWRHALINFKHPLLEQGLVVLDTPGLNAIGAEPELTLSLLPSAHAVLFILAADTGVTQSDLAIWRDHVGAGPGRMIVLNKIDGLWDGLRHEEEINAEIARQVDSCSHILNMSANHVFAISAQKGLVAKINEDAALLEKSRLPQLEQALAADLLPAKQEIVALGTIAEANQLVGESTQLLATRRAALVEQLAELHGLRGKNEQVIEQMVTKVKGEKDVYERGLREYYAVRSVFSQLSETLFSHLGLANLRANVRRTREAMQEARFKPQLMMVMSELFASARESLDASDKDLVEIRNMMLAMHEKFGQAYGLVVAPPPSFSLDKRRLDLDELEQAFKRQFGGFLNLLMHNRKTLIQQFFDTIVLQMRTIFDQANRDADHWLRAQMTPLESHVREVQRQLKHRLENVRRIHDASEGLEERIEELENSAAALNQKLAGLQEIQSGLAQALKPPTLGAAD